MKNDIIMPAEKKDIMPAERKDIVPAESITPADTTDIIMPAEEGIVPAEDIIEDEDITPQKKHQHEQLSPRSGQLQRKTSCK